NAMDSTVADAHHPDLGARNPLEQLVARFQLIGIEGELPRLNVDGGKLAFVGRLELGTDCFFVDGVATTNEFLFAIAALDRAHTFSPGSILWPKSNGPEMIVRGRDQVRAGRSLRRGERLPLVPAAGRMEAWCPRRRPARVSAAPAGAPDTSRNRLPQ